MWTAVFLVIMGLLAGMYITATPEKMKPIIEKQRKIAAQKKKLGKEIKKEVSQLKNENEVKDEAGGG
jgi:hypothetical protein